MARYTNYDDLLEKWHELGFDEISKIHKVNAFNHFIKTLPTADVVEVVRCRNCKHAYFRYNTKDTLQEIYACEKRPSGRCHKKVSGDFFCKHGERRTDNGN